MIKNKHIVIATLSAALAACGGGGDDATPSAGTAAPTGGATGGTGTGGGGTVGQPVSLGYLGFNYRQDLAASSSGATYVDNGVGVAGSLTFGSSATGTSRGTSVAMTPLSGGGIGYGAPFTSGVAIGSHPTDANLPAIAMLCQAAAVGDGTNGQKGTDVLVDALATPLTSVTALAGKTFNVYREDCATSAGASLAFDAAGNASTVNTNATRTFSAAAIASALGSGTLLSYTLGSVTVYVSIHAYSYLKTDASTAYAVVMNASPTPTGVTRGLVSVWAQQ